MLIDPRTGLPVTRDPRAFARAVAGQIAAIPEVPVSVLRQMAEQLPEQIVGANAQWQAALAAGGVPGATMPGSPLEVPILIPLAAFAALVRRLAEVEGVIASWQADADAVAASGPEIARAAILAAFTTADTDTDTDTTDTTDTTPED